jgi:hypothetical protein
MTLALLALLLQQSPALDTTRIREWREDLAVIRAQAAAHHANLFHTMSRAQFDSALASIEASLPRSTRAQVIVELQRLAALIGDGHSSVGPWRDTATVFRELPVTFYAFSDGLRIRAATAAHADLLGATVVAIGSVPVDSALARVRPLVSRDNEMGVLARAPMLLAMPEILAATGLAPDPGHVTLTLDTPKGRRDVTLKPAGLFPMLTGDIDRSWMPREGWVDARDGAPTPALAQQCAGQLLVSLASRVTHPVLPAQHHPAGEGRLASLHFWRAQSTPPTRPAPSASCSTCD